MSQRENFLSIEGNLVADPEIRFTPTGKAVCNLTLAHNERRRLVDGTYVDGDPSYFDIVAWEQLALAIDATFSKGDRITVTGSLVQRSWVDTTTEQKRYKIEIRADMVAPSLRFATCAITKASFRTDEPVHAMAGAATAGYSPDEEPFG